MSEINEAVAPPPAPTRRGAAGGHVMCAEPVRLSAESRRKFKEAVRTANPVEILTVIRFVETYAHRFTKDDLRFMNSCIGRRCNKLIYNLPRNRFRSWDD